MESVSRSPLEGFGVDWSTIGNRPKKQPSLKDAVEPGRGRIPLTEHFDRLANAMTRPFPSLAAIKDKYRGQTLVIVGGGPSLQDTFKTIRRDCRLSHKVKVLAPNKSHDFLLSKGFRPGKELHFGVVLDPMEWVASYQAPTPGVKYLLGSTIHDKTWKVHERAKSDAYVWHPVGNIKHPTTGQTEQEWLTSKFPGKPWMCVPGPSTVGLRSICLGIAIGFSHFELHGFDSCYADKSLYAYAKPNVAIDPTLKGNDTVSWEQVAPDGDRMSFTANRMMSRQVYEWIDMLKMLLKLADKGEIQRPSFAVHGWGAIPWLAAKAGMHADPEVNRKYAIREAA